MRELAGSAAIITGASRGVGAQLAQAFARRGIRVALAARSAQELEGVRRAIAETGAQAIAVPVDITDPAGQAHLVDETLRAFGAIDLLINNAGIVLPSAYEQLSQEELAQHLAVNLAAPMALAWRVLPHMLERDRGHIVNVASLAGLLGVGFAEAYSATKHGLVGFTRALRSSCRVSGSHVSASVICPGFIDEVGMYADNLRKQGLKAPLMLGTSSPEAMIKAIFQAIERDSPEIIVSSRPVRLITVLSAISPRLGEWLCQRLGAHRIFEAAAKESGRERRLPRAAKP